MSRCEHIDIEPVMITREVKHSNDDVVRVPDGNGFQCQGCNTLWRYDTVADLPHWLWVRLGKDRWMYDPVPDSIAKMARDL